MGRLAMNPDETPGRVTAGSPHAGAMPGPGPGGPGMAERRYVPSAGDIA